MIKNATMRLLAELLKDSKKSDRELAKVLGVSQPTVTRMRRKLVEEGLIRGFTVDPDLQKLGFEILAISCVKLKVTDEMVEKSKEWMNSHPNIIFAAAAEGMGKTGVIISLHKNYADYAGFVSENRPYWGEFMEDYDTMLVSLKGLVVKPLALSYLAKLMEKPEVQH
jgi:DNA-binding Lrp family transcriptional regulator